MVKICLLFIALLSARPISAEAVIQGFNGSLVRVDVKSWKEMRDSGIVKQDYDFSCGAASIATLLGGAYGVAVTEAQILTAMSKQNGRASFEDMALVVERFGFQAQGYSATFAQLQKLKVPVILYVKHRKYDHFTVLRGINGDTVWLADPSVGNQTLSREQFLDMWHVKEAGADGVPERGKFLAILPVDSQVFPLSQFFVAEPIRRSKPAILQLPFTRRH